LTRKKVGLALGGGAARGLAHIGVLSALERAGIPIDLIAGTSMGAIVGGLYAAGKDLREIRKAIAGLGRLQMFSMIDLGLPMSGFIKGKKITDWLRSLIGGIHFEDLKIPFACTATDINSCEEVILNQGPVAEAVRASASIPVIFTPAKWQGRYLVDGVLIDPVPVKVAREMGADLVIAVNVVPYIGDKLQREAATRTLQEAKSPNIFNIMVRMLYIVGFQTTVASLKEADVTIGPEVSHVRSEQFHRLRECMLCGERAAAAAIPQIKSLL
jgi:NTE family protein